MPVQQQEEDDIGLVLQPGKIQRIVKATPDVFPLNKEATAIFAKATELFLSEVCLKALENSNKEPGHKQIEYDHVVLAVKDWAACDFLADIVPQKVLGAVVLEQISSKDGVAEDKKQP